LMEGVNGWWIFKIADLLAKAVFHDGSIGYTS